MENKTLVFDLGGSSIKFSNDNVKSFETINIENISKQKVLDFISNKANTYNSNIICISAPGIIDAKSGKVSGMSAILDWHSENIFLEIKKYLNNKETKIFIENDANCSLLGNVKSLDYEIESAISIVIGTGIGGAYYSNHKIVHGFNNCVGEFGMNRMFDDPKKTISTSLSTNALCVLVNQKLNTSYNGKQIFDLYEKQDLKIVELVNSWIYKNAIFIYNNIWTLDPQVIFMGGAIATNNLFKEKLLTYVDDLFKEVNMKNNCQILFSIDGNKSNLLGALYLSK